MRFRCVCKSWNLLILKNPNFIPMHFNNYYISSSSNSSLLVKSGTENIYSLVSFDNKHNSIHPATMSVSNLHPPPICETVYPLSCCHGIVLVSSVGLSEIALWNPITKDFKTIPPNHDSLTAVYRRPIESHEELYMEYVRGFGFDSDTNNYKILEIFYYSPSPTELKRQVGVYTLSTDSWRILDDDDVFRIVQSVGYTINPGYKNNRFVCWLASVNNFRDQVILSFDMCDEMFRITQLPEDIGICGGKQNITTRIIPWYDRSIALIDYNQIAAQTFDIWVMNEFGVEESWTRLVSVGPLSESFNPLGFRKNNEFILQNHLGNLVFYNRASRQIRDLGICGVDFKIYKESLLSVSGQDVSRIHG